MPNNGNRNGTDLERLTTRITGRAWRILQHVCNERYHDEAGRVPYGRVISELVEAKYGRMWNKIEPTAATGPATVKKRLAKSA